MFTLSKILRKLFILSLSIAAIDPEKVGLANIWTSQANSIPKNEEKDFPVAYHSYKTGN